MSDFDKSDWDKTVVPESSGLGIRSTINRTLNSHEDTLHSEAKKLFESMNVMEEIIEALNLGATSVNILSLTSFLNQELSGSISGLTSLKNWLI